MAFDDREAYLEWNRRTWAGQSWEHLPGYSRVDVAERAARYAGLTGAGAGLGPSFDGYHDEVMEPWVGPEFFQQKQRIGVFLREYPLPCRDRRWKTLDPGLGGTARLPANAMSVSVSAAKQPMNSYSTITRALRGARDTVAALFDENAPDYARMADRLVIADWVRPFAMFRDFKGSEFDGALSKKSTHREEMYAHAAPLFAEEVGANGLDLDIVIVMVLGQFERVWPYLEPKSVVHPKPDRRGRFSTMRTRPESPWGDRRKVIVLPHPATNSFDEAMFVITGSESWASGAPRVIAKAPASVLSSSPHAAGGHGEVAGGSLHGPSDTAGRGACDESAPGAVPDFPHVHGAMMTALQILLEKLLVAEATPSNKLTYRRLSWPKSQGADFIEPQAATVVLKLRDHRYTVDCRRLGELNVRTQYEEDARRTCIWVPADWNVHQREQLAECIGRA